MTQRCARASSPPTFDRLPRMQSPAMSTASPLLWTPRSIARIERQGDLRRGARLTEPRHIQHPTMGQFSARIINHRTRRGSAPDQAAQKAGSRRADRPTSSSPSWPTPTVSASSPPPSGTSFCAATSRWPAFAKTRSRARWWRCPHGPATSGRRGDRIRSPAARWRTRAAGHAARGPGPRRVWPPMSRPT